MYNSRLLLNGLHVEGSVVSNDKRAQALTSYLLAKRLLLLVICSSVKMGIRLCYKWDEPASVVIVDKYLSVRSRRVLNQIKV
jgi:hypothetical protein